MGIEKTYKVGMYIRLSREDGDDRESESVENQRDIITNFIESKEDLELVDEYVDDGYTGTNFDRPGFKRLKEDVDNGKIDCVITKDLSRFGRDHIDTGFYLERYLPSLNIRYIAIGDQVDTLDSRGLGFLTFKLSFNDYYSQDISNKIRAVKKRKQEKGEYLGTYAPFGYKKDTDINNRNHLLLNEDTSEVVKRIYKLYLDGMGISKISNLLNEEGIPDPSSYLNTERYNKCSHKWRKGTIYRILKSEVYLGTIVSHKSYKINHKVKKRITVPKNEMIYVKNKHEPIIDEETFNKVQAKLSKSGESRNRVNYNPIKQFVYCGVCGRKASLKTHKRKVKSGEIHIHQYFRCNKKGESWTNCDNGTIRNNILLPLVEKTLKEECSKIVFSKGDLTSIYEQAKESTNNKRVLIKRQIEKSEKEISSIEKKIEQVYADKIEGVIRAEDFTKFYDSYQEKKEKLNTKIRDLKKDLTEMNNDKIIDYRKIKKLAEECLNMEKLDSTLLEKLIDRIEYFKGRKIKIKFKFTENKVK